MYGSITRKLFLILGTILFVYGPAEGGTVSTGKHAVAIDQNCQAEAAQAACKANVEVGTGLWHCLRKYREKQVQQNSGYKFSPACENAWVADCQAHHKKHPTDWCM
jgi:hypothetical protein